MTMQTFVVLFLGISFGFKISLATVGLYLLEGIVGLPVFSGSPERGVGLVYFTGPTMGYLIGFLSACFLSSLIKINDNYYKIFLKLILAVSTIYILGVLWLGTVIGWDKPIIEMGVMPFLLAEFLKVVLLTVITKKILKLRKFI
jgi:biotin transport system substrate-specific component